MAAVALRLLALLALAPASAFVVQRVSGANQSELKYLSAAGGAHVYIGGTDLGSAFAPPSVFIGNQAQAECKVQPFTSNRNRLHCIVHADNLPPPDWKYDPNGRNISFPLRVSKGARLAQCWHVGGANHGCFILCAPASAPPLSSATAAPPFPSAAHPPPRPPAARACASLSRAADPHR